MFTLQRLSLTAALAGSALLAGCADSLSPDTVDPQQLNGDVQVLASTFDNNAAFQAMKNLAPHFPAYSITRILRATLPDADVIRGRGLFAPRVMADPRVLADLRAPSGTHALFPSDVLGKTLVWDTLTSGYIVGNAPGAPANGIRLILYVADPATGMPFVPLQPIGNLDLTDESTAQANRLGVLLRLGGTTIADYDVTLQVATTSVSVRAAGFMRSTDGAYQADFDLSTSFNLSGGHIAYRITGSDGTFVYFDINAGQTGSAIVFQVGRGENTIEIAGTDNGQTVTGTIKFNGTPVGTISGPSDDPTIAGANGRTLTAEQITALEAIFQAAAEFIGNFAEGIVGPASVVFGSVGI
jgi:outer membrane murein-binding lipoprotein Lpp